jgi:hypothetical protein
MFPCSDVLIPVIVILALIVGWYYFHKHAIPVKDDYDPDSIDP